MAKNKLLNKLRGVKEPRSLPDIQKEYSQVSGQAANAGYQAFVYSEEQSRLHKLMKEINQEAKRRQELDAEAAANVKKQKEDNAKS